MQTIKLTQDIEHEGLAAGDVLSVDENSAAALVRRGAAEVYDPAAPADVAEPQEATYGDQEGVRTIDDIRDPQAARNRRVMSFATVAAPDPGPAPATPAVAPADPAPADPDPAVTAATEPEAKAPKRSGRTSPEQAAPDAQSVGGDAGGGNS